MSAWRTPKNWGYGLLIHLVGFGLLSWKFHDETSDPEVSKVSMFIVRRENNKWQ